MQVNCSCFIGLGDRELNWTCMGWRAVQPIVDLSGIEYLPSMSFIIHGPLHMISNCPLLFRILRWMQRSHSVRSATTFNPPDALRIRLRPLGIMTSSLTPHPVFSSHGHRLLYGLSNTETHMRTLSQCLAAYGNSPRIHGQPLVRVRER